MKTVLNLLILMTFGFSFSQTKNQELDLIDAYNLKIENVELFGNINSQLELFGLPKKVFDNNNDLEFETKKEVLSSIKKTTNFSVVSFNGIEFWCFNDFESIPAKIDFRNFNKKISNDKLTLNRNYKLNDFKKDFPNSFKNSPKMPKSFFQMSTKENIDDLKHYFVERKTKSDPDKRILIELTFEDDKLIYVFFTNF